MSNTLPNMDQTQSSAPITCFTCGKAINNKHKQYLDYIKDLMKKKLDQEKVFEENVKFFKTIGLKLSLIHI